MIHLNRSYIMHWFVRKSIFFIPVTVTGWFVLGTAIAYLAWVFVDIDSHSHSASDTLINWLFQALIVGAGYALLGYFTEKQSG